MMKSIKNDFRQKGNVWTSHNVVIAIFYMHENLFLLFFVEEKLSLKMGHRVKIKFFAFLQNIRRSNNLRILKFEF